MNYRNKLLLTICAFLILPMGQATHAATLQNNFYNVVMQEGADPWVYKHTDGFTTHKTTGGNVTIWKSAQLTTIDAAPTRVVETGAAASGPGIALHQWRLVYLLCQG